MNRIVCHLVQIIGEMTSTLGTIRVWQVPRVGDRLELKHITATFPRNYLITGVEHTCTLDRNDPDQVVTLYMERI